MIPTMSDVPVVVFMNEHAPASDRLEPIRNWRPTKPAGGLWTSPHRPDIISEWVEFAQSEMPHLWAPDGVYLLTPSSDARVIDMSAAGAIDAVLGSARRTLKDTYYGPGWMDFIDYEALSADYDGIYVPRGMTRLYLFSGWDVETILWFRWCFDDVKRLEDGGGKVCSAELSML